MSRRFLAVVCVVAATVLILGLLPGSALAGPDQAVLLMLKGKPLETAGELTTGTTFVPVEALSADLGFKVNTVRTGQLIVTYGDKKVVFTSGTTQVVVNGHETWCIQYSKDGSLMVPVRFLLENMGFRVVWSSDPQNTVDLYPVQENNVVIGTVRERQETAGLSLDIQYPKLRGLESAAIQDAANAFFAGRSEGAIAQGYQSAKDLAEAKTSTPDMPDWPTEVVADYTIEYNQNGLLNILFQAYLYTDLYEYTAYAAGFPEFRIPLASLSDVLVPEIAVAARQIAGE